MKLDRNVNANGQGKYALINLRTNQVEWGCKGDKDEFFVIKLRDKNARIALLAYADSVACDDKEFASEIRELAARSGSGSPYCKKPD
jgi:hypothetical protein